MKPYELALKFSAVIQDWLTEEELFLVNLTNAQRGYDSTCATHDVCDAKQAMIQACISHEHMLDDMNALTEAWTLAKRNSFNLSWPVTIDEPGLQRHTFVLYPHTEVKMTCAHTGANLWYGISIDDNMFWPMVMWKHVVGREHLLEAVRRIVSECNDIVSVLDEVTE